jgi:hypothetical protein
MCEVCKSEGHDFVFRNGPKNSLYNLVLYKVFKNNIANIRVCYIHNLELFAVGEINFLKGHLTFARQLAKKSQRNSESSSPFGF